MSPNSPSHRQPKVRGLRRRVRAVGRWAASFEGAFPDGLTAEDRYWNAKIPVHDLMVEGRHARQRVRRACAQHLIEAANHLIQAKPPSAAGFRVVATIRVPDMFGSEVCIYTDEATFQSKVGPLTEDEGSITPIVGRSLARAWGLALPEGLGERGALWDFRGRPEDDGPYLSEVWHFGEVG